MRSAFLLMLLAIASQAGASTCFGTVANGRLEGGVALPLTGENFVAYSSSPITTGRQFVHARVARIVLDAYGELHQRQPSMTFMFGETGLRHGGPFPPHKTHQNGLSVDFFVPVRDLAGQPVLLPATPANRFGYDIEFDQRGRYANYRVDFSALAGHLVALHGAALRHGAGVRQVILEPAFIAMVLATPHGPYLRRHLKFMRAKPWVRHDEHFHVDFALSCKAR